MPRKYSKRTSRATKRMLRERRKFPASKYLRQYIPRTDATKSLYGASYFSATDAQKKAREAGLVRGYGAYSVGKNWRRFSQGVGLTGIGRSLLSAGAGAAGAMMGAGMYTGQGSYNALIGDGVADEVPQMSSVADETGAVTVSRREYVCDIYGPTTAFANQAFPLNPGLEATFPWLAQIAQNYDEYELLQCIFTYRSTTTDVGTSTTGQCGTVIMATNYNAGAAPFADKVVMMEYDGAMSSKTTESQMHGVECDPSKLSESGHYIRSNPTVVGQDIKSYDHATFQLAVANSPAAFANQSIGELWVSYTVLLRKPKFHVSRGFGISNDLFVSAPGANTAALPMGPTGTQLKGQQNNIGCRLVCANNLLGITFPAAYTGPVEIIYRTENVNTVNPVTTGNPVLTGNIRGLSDLYPGDGTASITPAFDFIMSDDSVGGRQFAMFHYYITPASGGIDNSVTISLGPLNIAPTQASLTIQEYNTSGSYRNQNIGSSDAPVLVNASGVIVVPA